MNISNINTEARKLLDATSTSYTDADLLRRVNQAYEEVVGWLINADGTWQFDDSNYSSLPIGTSTLIDGQTSYSFASPFLSIEAVEVLDPNGIYQRIEPIDHRELGGLSPDEFFAISTTSGTPTGFPRCYDKWEDTIKLYPAPTASDVTLTNGLKVYYKRTADLFTSGQVTTGTKEPGFASPWHVILAYMSAIPEAQIHKKDRVPFLANEIARMKQELIDHYGQREKDKKHKLTPKRIRFK